MMHFSPWRSLKPRRAGLRWAAAATATALLTAAAVQPAWGAEQDQEVDAILRTIDAADADFLASTSFGAYAAPTTEPADPSDEVVTLPMEFVGFDEEVANANGFEIVTASDGTQSSVPVTEDAKMIQAEADARAAAAAAAGEVMARGVAYGNCGTSWVWAEKSSGDLLSVDTGYDVYMDVYRRNWSLVISSSWSGGGVYSWPVQPTSAYWEITWYGTVVGWGNVFAGGSTTLLNGTTCYSNDPADSFP